LKRANGTGTIVKLSGNRRRPYLIKVPARDKEGFITQRALSYHATIREAQAALDQYNSRVASGTAPVAEVLNVTVQNVYDAWSDREYKKLEKAGRISSMASHRAAWNKRVSRFAGRKMRDVSLDEWQSILDEDEDEDRSQSLINNDSILIRALYSYAMERDIVAKDYSQYLDIPSVGPKEKKGALDDIQLAKLEKLAIDGFPWADTVLMLCYTGYRISEFLGLTKFQHHPEYGGYFIAGVKTASGRDRIMPIHPKVKPYFDQRMARGSDYIITDGDGSPLTTWWYREYAFTPVVQALGMPDATPHWCRHTFNTRLFTAKVDDITRKLLMGHSVKNNVNAGYTHPTIEWFVEAVKRLA
jgi:site-specific recombinase, phage integrase family